MEISLSLLLNRENTSVGLLLALLLCFIGLISTKGEEKLELSIRLVLDLKYDFSIENMGSDLASFFPTSFVLFLCNLSWYIFLTKSGQSSSSFSMNWSILIGREVAKGLALWTSFDTSLGLNIAENFALASILSSSIFLY